MRYLLILILLASCAMDADPVKVDYGQARLYTIRAWKEIVGSVSDVCRDYTKTIIVEEVKDIPNDSKGMTTVGRFIYDESRILIATDNRDGWDRMHSAIHEYIHVLDWCVNAKKDKDHVDPTLWEDYGENTVEAVANDYL